jgi:hypothetical protein
MIGMTVSHYRILEELGGERTKLGQHDDPLSLHQA